MAAGRPGGALVRFMDARGQLRRPAVVDGDRATRRRGEVREQEPWPVTSTITMPNGWPPAAPRSATTG